MKGCGAQVRPWGPNDGVDADRCDVSDRKAHGSCAEEREIQGEGARGFGETNEYRSLPGAGGYPASDGAGGNANAGGRALRRVHHRAPATWMVASVSRGRATELNTREDEWFKYEIFIYFPLLR